MFEGKEAFESTTEGLGDREIDRNRLRRESRQASGTKAKRRERGEGVHETVSFPLGGKWAAGGDTNEKRREVKQ